MGEITRHELEKKLVDGDEFILLDVLPRAYFRHSHLPGALNLPVEEIESRIAEFVTDKSTLIVVYCLNPFCSAAPKAAQILKNSGYANVREYSGGKDDWRAAGLSLEGTSRRLRLI